MTDITARGMANTAIEQVVIVEERVDQLPNGIVFRGAVNDLVDLPANPEVGDCYTVINEYNTEYAYGLKDGVNQWIDIRPTLATVAYTGDYDDLDNAPDIPTKVSDLDNDAGYVNYQALAPYALNQDLENEVERLEGLIDNKQDELTEGDGIDIDDGTINVKVDGETIDFNDDGELIAIGGGGLNVEFDRTQFALNEYEPGHVRVESLLGYEKIDDEEQFCQIEDEIEYDANNNEYFTEGYDVFSTDFTGGLDNYRIEIGFDGNEPEVINNLYGHWINDGVFEIEVNADAIGQIEITTNGDWPLTIKNTMDHGTLTYLAIYIPQGRNHPINPDFIPIDYDTLDVNGDGQIYVRNTAGFQAGDGLWMDEDENRLNVNVDGATLQINDDNCLESTIGGADFMSNRRVIDDSEYHAQFDQGVITIGFGWDGGLEQFMNDATGRRTWLYMRVRDGGGNYEAETGSLDYDTATFYFDENDWFEYIQFVDEGDERHIVANVHCFEGVEFGEIIRFVLRIQRHEVWPIKPNVIPIDNETIRINDDDELFADFKQFRFVCEPQMIVGVDPIQIQLPNDVYQGIFNHRYEGFYLDGSHVGAPDVPFTFGFDNQLELEFNHHDSYTNVQLFTINKQTLVATLRQAYVPAWHPGESLVPTPPDNGNYVLKAVDGEMTWVEE